MSLSVKGWNYLLNSPSPHLNIYQLSIVFVIFDTPYLNLVWMPFCWFDFLATTASCHSYFPINVTLLKPSISHLSLYPMDDWCSRFICGGCSYHVDIICGRVQQPKFYTFSSISWHLINHADVIVTLDYKLTVVFTIEWNFLEKRDVAT